MLYLCSVKRKKKIYNIYFKYPNFMELIILFSCISPEFKVTLSEMRVDSDYVLEYRLEFSRLDGSYVSNRSFSSAERSKALLAYLSSVNNILSSVY